MTLYDDNEDEVPPPIFDETKLCVKQFNKRKATSPDDIPIEKYQCSATATQELHELITTIWKSERVPHELVLTDMMMIYKKK